MDNSPIPLQDCATAVLAEVQLVATDMDGNLTQQGKFTPDLLHCLADLATAGCSRLIVTGRSAGWVQGLVAYLPIDGAIAENGGVFIPKDTWQPRILVELPAIAQHRDQLAALFWQLQQIFPDLQPSTDNVFRLTDWTFDIGTLSLTQLQTLEQTCQAAGWGFTYSSVQCHIRPALQDKGRGLQRVLQAQFPRLTPQQVVTVGDSPNDQELFDPARFPLSVGVANVASYGDRLRHRPRFITASPEGQGFQELARRILASRSGP